tara:strand:+ start:4672 stop:6009 length:1338 start_codon:yes stop_codon:yes gene_type:complete
MKKFSIIKSYGYISLTISTLIFTANITASNKYNNNDQNVDPIPLEQIQNFTNAIYQIKKNYVKPIDDKVLFDNAIRGMLTGLDPHSDFLDEDEFSDLKISTSGKFGGLGIEVTQENGLIKVVSPLDDTPAKKAGIKSGDYIIKIDTSPVNGLSLKESVALMRGEIGTDITLIIVREGESKPLTKKITRDIIKIKSVKSELIDGKYGYIRIAQFQSNTTKNLETAIVKLQKQAKGNLRGFILDLRDNPGGILDAAVEVSDLFLNNKSLNYHKLIVSTKGRAYDSSMQEYSKTKDKTNGLPLVVLVNNGSASASEIVAGALQDHHRAIIAGSKTFGKGSVQTILGITQDQALKLTTALYYTPNGRSIQAQGIVPDVEISNITVKEIERPRFIMSKEADLKNHLDVNKKITLKKVKDKKSYNDDMLKSDYQLHQAINILKSVVIAKKI